MGQRSDLKKSKNTRGTGYKLKNHIPDHVDTANAVLRETGTALKTFMLAERSSLK